MRRRFEERHRATMKKTKVYARQHVEGMAIYAESDGVSTFVTTHRKNNNLFFYLCDEGKTIREMKSYKPGRSKAEQRFGKSLKHVIKLAELALDEFAA